MLYSVNYNLNFALKDSLALSVEEQNGIGTPVNLNVVRKKGFSGRVSVQWQATGDQSSIGDIRPLAGFVNLLFSEYSYVNELVLFDQTVKLYNLIFVFIDKI